MAKEGTGQLPAIPVLVQGAENRIKIRHEIIANTVRNAKKVLDVVFSTFSLDKICSYGIMYLRKKVYSGRINTIH